MKGNLSRRQQQPEIKNHKLPLSRKQGNGVLLVWAVAQTSKDESKPSFLLQESGRETHDHGIWMGKHHVQKINMEFELETQEKPRSEKRAVARACLRWMGNTDESRACLHHGSSCLPTPPAGGPRRPGQKRIFPSATERAVEGLLGSAGGEESGRSGMEDGFVKRKHATPVGWGKKMMVVEVLRRRMGTAVGGARWESQVVFMDRGKVW